MLQHVVVGGREQAEEAAGADLLPARVGGGRVWRRVQTVPLRLMVHWNNNIYIIQAFQR